MGIVAITISQRLALPEFHSQELRLGQNNPTGWSLHPTGTPSLFQDQVAQAEASMQSSDIYQHVRTPFPTPPTQDDCLHQKTVLHLRKAQLAAPSAAADD